MAALFACNLPDMKCGWFAGHTWTLAYEEQFYIVFPILFALAGRFAKQVFAVLLIVLVVYPFLRFLLNLGDVWHAIANFVPSFSFVCAGAVVAAYEGTVQQLSGGRYAKFITVSVVAFLFGILFLNATFAFPLGGRLAYMQVSLSNIILPSCTAWLVGSSVHQSNWFTTVLTARPLLFFGMISYSLYLWQQLFAAPPHFYISNSPLMFAPLMLIHPLIF
jgi:peptidoglycan/LPS O-acetylase OafA/YrhL